MTLKPFILGVFLSLPGVAALADDDCNDPIARWQPRETLRQQLEAEGWTIYRIKVDDGCYEVKGVDPQGVAAKASYSPASLMLMKWEREHDNERRQRDEREGRTRDADHNTVPQTPH